MSEHSCYGCGEPASIAVDAWDEADTDRGTERREYKEWFCPECYDRMPANRAHLP